MLHDVVGDDPGHAVVTDRGVHPEAEMYHIEAAGDDRHELLFSNL